MKTLTQSKALLLALVVGLSAAACGSKDGENVKANGKGQAAKVAPGVAAKSLKAPAEIILWGGTPALSTTLSKVSALGKSVAPVPPSANLQALIQAAFQGEFRLKDAKVIDAAGPLRFAIANPKIHRLPAVLIVRVSSKDAFAKAIPDSNKKADDAGNAWSWTKHSGSKRPIYANFIDGWVIITRSASLFPDNKAFFKKLSTATIASQGVAFVEVAHAMALFGGEFKAGLGQAKRMIIQAAKAAPGGDAQLDMVNAMFDWGVTAADQLEQVQLNLDLQADGAQLRTSLTPKAGSGLAKTFTGLKGSGKRTLLAKAPADAAFFMHGNFDPKVMKGLSAGLMRTMLVKPIFGGDEAAAKPYLDAMSDYLDNLSGEGLMAAHGTDGLSLVGIFGIKDAKAVRAAQRTLTGMHKAPATRAYYEKMGIETTVQTAAYTVADVPVDIVSTKLAGLGAGAMAFGAGALQDMMTQHIAIGNNLAVIGYGSTGRQTIEGVMGPKAKGGLDTASSTKRTLKHAAKNAFMLLFVSPLQIAQRIKLGGMNPLAAMFAGLPSDAGLSITAGIDGASLQIVVDVPIKAVKQGMAAFEKTKGAF